MKTWLVDTGPLVAFLDERDDAHARVAEAWASFTGIAASTSAVITEAMHFVSADPRGPALLAELVTAGRFRVFDVCQPPDLLAAAALMSKYRDTPMDFADATLVLLAEALGTREVLTLDRRGFTTYRIGGRKAFRLVLGA